MKLLVVYVNVIYVLKAPVFGLWKIVPESYQTYIWPVTLFITALLIVFAKLSAR